MSLILDALQQADQERRGAAPSDLFSPALAPAPAAPPATPHNGRTMGWLVLVVLALIALAGWMAWWMSLPAPVQSSPESATESVAPPAIAATPVPATAKAPEVPTPTTPSAIAPPKAEPPRAMATATPQAPAPAMAQAPSMAPQPAAAAPIAADLPADTQATLPSLTVTGHTYSDNPTLRSLMIDGRMFVEGQALEPGLRLERIGPHQAVFNLRGTRFGVDY